MSGVKTTGPSTRLAPMQIIKDEFAYDALQQYLVHVIAEDVRDMLQQAAASGASFEDAVQSITLGIAGIIDGNRKMEHDDKPVMPVLMFGLLDEDENLGDVLTSGEPSFMSEYAASAARDVAPA